MRMGTLAAVAASVLLSWACGASGALAARVILLTPDRHARIATDRFLSVQTLTPAPAARALTPARAAAGPAHLADSGRTMVSELQRLRRTGAISAASFAQDMNDWKGALATVKRLHSERAAELEAVVENLHSIAADGELEPSRLPALFLTLERNVQWWTQGPLLSDGQDVEFTGSQLVWEYYPGQGIELQQLASFGKADGLYTAGPADYPEMKELLAELIPLAADRAGGISWEYYFNFDGGSPPWTSAMTQGTALEALTRASEAFHDPSYLQLAQRALPVLAAPPPSGVSLPTALGRRFIQYSFAPGTEIINAFLQTLIGLYDYAHVSDDALAQQLFAAGNAEAQAEVPQFNTGAWSLYQPGLEDDLSYHELVTGFLQQLCTRTAAPVYCTTASAFEADLTTPPTLAQLTVSAAAGAPFTLRFDLSKESHVGIVLERGTQTVFLTSADFGYGLDAFTVPPLKQTGVYSVRLAATDLAGNFNRSVGVLEIVPRGGP
ncbi:MAG: D-glucuronyl C5-epimerase family protein [Solirubrobacteraceae bacterium]